MMEENVKQAKFMTSSVRFLENVQEATYNVVQLVERVKESLSH
jgi:hypothetical protein